MEVYFQTAKNIFEATHRKKYFEEQKRTMSDIHPRLFHLRSGRGEHVRADGSICRLWGRINTLCNLLKMRF